MTAVVKNAMRDGEMKRIVLLLGVTQAYKD